MSEDAGRVTVDGSGAFAVLPRIKMRVPFVVLSSSSVTSHLSNSEYVVI